MGPAVGAAEVGDFVGVGGDDDLVEGGAAERGLVDPLEHGFAGERAEDLAGEAGGGEAGGDDAEDAGGALLSGQEGIQYDGVCLCQWRFLWLRRASLPGR